MIKKISIFVMMLLSIAVLVACTSVEYTVTFDTKGGSPVAAVQVKKGETLNSPTDPTKLDYVFSGWFEKEDYTGEAYNFSAPVEADLKLYARWLLDESTAQYVRFVDHRQNTTNINVANEAGIVEKPADPTRDGYRFGGWYTSKAGLTWTDKTEFNFTQAVPEGGVTVYAYWEPLNSKAHNWTDAETYFSTLPSSTPFVLNPLNYEYANELQLIQTLATPLYTQEVDWGQAIKDGVAAFPGDFSKFGTGAGKFGIDLLKNHYILAGAASYPKNEEGHDLVDEEGNWSIDNATTFLDDKWVIEIRNDLKFEDGRPITAADFVYAYKQYIDPKQNNKRGSTFFPTEDRRNGYPIINSRSYFLQEPNEDGVKGTVAFDTVGFKATGTYTLELSFERDIAQTSAVGLMNNIYLVHPEKYEASLDDAKEKSNYGTKLSPYVSYGGYIIKSWDENAKLIFNKNYDYVLKHTINYKSISYQYTSDEHENMELFKTNKLSAVGLSGDYAAEFAEWPHNYPTYQGYPFSMEMNMTDALDGTRPVNPIMLDKDFRKALLFGFDRQGFANTVFAPNTASIMVWPIEGKQYTGDEFWYKDTQEHKDVLEALGINEDTVGFDSAKAVQHFNLAYNAWVAKGNSGVIQIDFVGRNTPLHIKYSETVIAQLETLFNANGEKINFTYDPLDSQVFFARVDGRKFDIAFDTGGWGFADASFVYMPLKGLYYTWLFGADAGGNGFEDVPGLADAVVYKALDMRSTLAHLEATKYVREADEATPSGFWDEETAEGTTLQLYDLLVANEGYYEGSAIRLFNILVNDDFIYVGTEEPFPGAVDDLTRITAAFEYIILDLVTLLPIGSSTTITAYAANVKIVWPEYSYELGWGTARYRYLTTDPDFAN